LLLPRSFLERGAEEVARALLGCRLISSIEGAEVGGRIVETEAYVGAEDPASHAAARIGRTARNDAMFGPGGTAYVYFVYGMHWCFNVVTGHRGDPQAVLIRALEPELGLPTMRERRGASPHLTNGPARLAAALSIDGRMNGHRLSDPPLRLFMGKPAETERVGVSGRIGIREAREWPLRFFLEGHPNLSRQ
jgi:DNA-3-methyladenine glycosylase